MHSKLPPKMITHHLTLSPMVNRMVSTKTYWQNWKAYTSKFKLEQSILPWTGLLASVSAFGQYDVAITGALVTDDRPKVFDFVAPVASAQHYYVKRAGDDSIKSVADLNGKTMGCKRVARCWLAYRNWRLCWPKPVANWARWWSISLTLRPMPIWRMAARLRH